MLAFCKIDFSFDSRLAATLLGGVLLCGCGPNPATSGTSPAAEAKKASAAVATEAASPKLTNGRPQSVFSSTVAGVIDPFFPKSTRFQEKVSKADGVIQAGNAPIDIGALLSAGFQGTMGTGTDRLALVNNTILEPGKNSEISITRDGKTQPVKVHCVQITRNTAVVTVAGRAEPIVLSLKTTGIVR